VTTEEPLLLDDLATTSDLKSKVDEAWREFATALAEVITGLKPGVHLEITLDPTASGTGHAVYEVSVQRRPGGELGALAVGNAGLPEGHRLDRNAVANMVVLGWSPPGVIEGSGRDFGMLGAGDNAAKYAVIITKTIRDVFGAPHPAFLTYTAHDEDDEQVATAALGTARHSDGRDPRLEALKLGDAGFAILEDPNMPLEERVRIVVAGVQRVDPDTLQVDSDGDIGIRAGSAMVFVRVKEVPPLVDVFSPILTDVKATEKLYTKLSELTTKMPVGRLYHANETVWASVPVFGRDFQATHLMLALQVMTGLADELDDRLHGEFGGKRFFADGDAAAPAEAKAEEDVNTGMYL
jgi:type III secretion system-like peptide-binding chaperone